MKKIMLISLSIAITSSLFSQGWDKTFEKLDKNGEKIIMTLDLTNDTNSTLAKDFQYLELVDPNHSGKTGGGSSLASGGKSSKFGGKRRITNRNQKNRRTTKRRKTSRRR